MSATIEFSTPELGHSIFHLDPVIPRMDDDEFFEFCRRNEEWRIEQTSSGDLIIMPGTGGITGRRNMRLIVTAGNWAGEDGTGELFDSSTMFLLPNGARRSPDLSWVRRERWNALTEREQEKFPPVCPDFVVDLRSRTDWLPYLEAKLEEYIENGAQLGWLIDPLERRVYVYRPGAAVEVLENPKTVSGEPILRGFELSLAAIWD
jgi:Uma2 family endonuclease